VDNKKVKRANKSSIFYGGKDLILLLDLDTMTSILFVHSTDRGVRAERHLPTHYVFDND